MHIPEAVANYFINRAWGDNKDLTPIQVLKLGYIAHGWTLGYTDGPLINHEVEAWKYGPVVPSIYHRFKHYGNQPIGELAQDFESPFTAKYSTEENTILDAVWKNYGDMDGMTLSTLTHAKGTPWYQVWVEEGGSGRSNAVIEDEKIKHYYTNLINTRESVHG